MPITATAPDLRKGPDFVADLLADPDLDTDVDAVVLRIHTAGFLEADLAVEVEVHNLEEVAEHNADTSQQQGVSAEFGSAVV